MDRLTNSSNLSPHSFFKIKKGPSGSFIPFLILKKGPSRLLIPFFLIKKQPNPNGLIRIIKNRNIEYKSAGKVYKIKKDNKK